MVGQPTVSVKTQADHDGAAVKVVKAFARLVVAPDPAVDLSVGVVADLADDGLAVTVNGGDAVACPLVFCGLAAGAEAVGALPGRIVSMADGQRCGARGLAFAGEAAVAVVAVAGIAVVIG